MEACTYAPRLLNHKLDGAVPKQAKRYIGPRLHYCVHDLRDLVKGAGACLTTGVHMHLAYPIIT